MKLTQRSLFSLLVLLFGSSAFCDVTLSLTPDPGPLDGNGETGYISTSAKGPDSQFLGVGTNATGNVTSLRLLNALLDFAPATAFGSLDAANNLATVSGSSYTVTLDSYSSGTCHATLSATGGPAVATGTDLVVYLHFNDSTCQDFTPQTDHSNWDWMYSGESYDISSPGYITVKGGSVVNGTEDRVSWSSTYGCLHVTNVSDVCSYSL